MQTISEAKKFHRENREQALQVARMWHEKFLQWGGSLAEKWRDEAVELARVHQRRLLSVIRAEKYLTSGVFFGEL